MYEFIGKVKAVGERQTFATAANKICMQLPVEARGK